MSPGVFVRVLGPVSVDSASADLSPALRRLLAILVARRREVVSTESLVDWMWPDGPPGGDGLRALRTAVSRLRSVVGSEAVVTESPGYRLSLSPEQMDVGRFEASVVDGGGVPSPDRLEKLAELLGLWRGEAWQEYSTEDWVRGEAVRLEELRVHAEETRLGLLFEVGRRDEAIADGESFVSRWPYRERGWQILVEALASTGRGAEALRTVQAYRDAMAEAGLEASEGMRRLESRVLVGDFESPDPTGVEADRRDLSNWDLNTGGFAFVGRASDLTTVVDAVEGQSRWVLVSGEPGIGKSRLVQEAAEQLVERGQLVLTGRCSEDFGAPYAALSAALAEYAAAAAGRPRPSLAEDAADLVESLLHRSGASQRSDDVEAEQFRTLAAIRDFLAALVEGGGVVLVIDDLHWVDSSTKAVLGDVLVRRPIDGLTVVATYRDTEPTSRAAFGSLLADLERDHLGQRLELSGLDRFGVSELVLVAAAGADGDGVAGEGTEVVAELVADRTQGNPLFASQILRHLVDSETVQLVDGTWTLVERDAVQQVPRQIRSVVEQRVDRLGAKPARLLDTAAVAGLDFDVRVVAHVARLGPDEAIELADDAVAAGLLREDPNRFAVYGFAHALVRDSLADRQSPTRRSTTSWAIAEHLEELAGDAAPEKAAELAHHYTAGRSSGDPHVAARWSRLAGEQAYRAAAFADALERCGEAIESLGLAGITSGRELVELLALRLRVLRRSAPAQQVDEDAAAALDLAIELADADLIADIAAGDVGPLVNYDPARPSTEPVALATRALDALDESERPARIRVSAARTFWVHRMNDLGAPDLADEVIAQARQQDDAHLLAQTIATVLHAYQRSTKASTLDSETQELESLIDITGLHGLRAPAIWGRSFGVIRAGDQVAWEALIDELEHEAKRVGWATGVWTAAMHRVALRCARGDVAAAVGSRDDLVALGGELGVPPALPAVYAEAARVAAMVELGQLEEAADTCAVLARSMPAIAVSFGALAAYALVDLGRLDEARTWFDMILVDEFAPLQFMAMHEVNLGWAGVVAGHLGEHDAAEEIHTQLSAFAGRMIWTTHTFCGPVDLWIARASVSANEPEQALAEFESAESMCRESGTATWLARVLLHRAQLYVARGETALAADSAREAFAVSEPRGLKYVAERSSALLESL